jgi:hypothetical protein
MMTLGLILLFVLISLLDLPRLLKQKQKKELYLYSVLLGSAFVLSELHILRIDLWSPNRMITDVVRFFLAQGNGL